MKERIFWTREIKGDNPTVSSVADAERGSQAFLEAALAKERVESLRSRCRAQVLPAELLLSGDAQKLDVIRQAGEPKKLGLKWGKENTQTQNSYVIHDFERYPFQMTYQVTGRRDTRTVLPQEYIQMLQPNDEFKDWRLIYPYLRLSFTEGQISSLTLDLQRKEVGGLDKNSFLKKLSPDSLLHLSLGLPNDSAPWLEVVSGIDSGFGGGGKYIFNAEKNQFEVEQRKSPKQPTALNVDMYEGLLSEMLDFIPHDKITL